jgi:hypothetical protein
MRRSYRGARWSTSMAASTSSGTIPAYARRHPSALIRTIS